MGTAGTETVALQGELDFATAFDVEMRLEEAIARSERVVVDLSGVTFIDSTGVSTLLAARQAARRADVDFTLRPGPPNVQQVFSVAGLLDELPFAGPR